MPESLAVLIVHALTLHVGCGVVVAAALLLGDVARLDPGLQQAPYAVRLLIAPGLVALWPIFAWRRIARRATPLETNAHRRAASLGDGPRSRSPRDVHEVKR